MTENEKIEKLKRLIAIQETDGNYNNSEYMYGMLNGMLCALSVFTEESCNYPERPEMFKSDIKTLDKFNNSSIIVSNITKSNQNERD